jgi:amidophosphoribosyltransferase
LPAVLSAIEQDTDNTVFSYILAETFFYGLVEAAQDFLKRKKNYILEKNR